ncbi:hypothetical protein TrispH2_006596 [Trichoplax sp. H2]|uniref:Uncharacterized protein n=1 Tax=Trichoplax adhaerens TaxID=10228 RepID=B3S325_TRIAD|nr:predicted protein [Trichoplax adhaerens]EDV22892.1 predicted protein [Trichoplax adhaerens]RDD42716.1 hypothetical protein TrispH2_006596 [Trichoplax sp. H2]|eukprot:XP_002114758.1 predicted protein [Trichoplax adhaerens]
MASFISRMVSNRVLQLEKLNLLQSKPCHSQFRTLLNRVKKANFSSQETIRNAHHTLKDVLNEVDKKLEANVESKHLFLGTCRYYNHKVNDRFVIVNLGDRIAVEDAWSQPQCLIDTALSRDDIEELKKSIPKLTRCASFSVGEVDGYFNSPWQFGYYLQPNFTVFTTLGLQFMMRTIVNEKILFLHNGACKGQSINLAHVDSVRVEVSDDPWSSRNLILKMKDSDELKDIIEDSRINLDAESKRDLASLMIETEWLVTVAAYLSIAATTAANRKVPLQLADVLTTRGNPWVEMRNSAWIKDSNAA